MAEQHQQHQRQQQSQPLQHMEGVKGMLQQKGPRASTVAALAALVPLAGVLLTLSGVTLAGTVVGLAVATPLFILFSPVLVPAAFVVGLAVTGFLASGAFGLTALSALSWIVNYFRGRKGAAGMVMEPVDYAKRRLAEGAGYVGQRTRDVGQGIQSKAHEAART
ncbi:oleosin H2-like [Typha angustifolia]|uniref:oleosin H2-like n=1 Tax=Typha angustifolia TaxID=59011 RepID=UPI003C2EC71E